MESEERTEERRKVVLNGIEETPHIAPTTKTINRLFLIGLVIAALGLGLILHWATQSNEVLKIKNNPFPVRTIREHPTPDGVVILTANYCKTQNITGKTRISFVSSTREIFLPEAPESGPKDCKETEVPILIPKNLTPDVYKIKFVVTYDINPLKKNVTQEFESQKFTIVAPGGPGSERVVSQ